MSTAVYGLVLSGGTSSRMQRDKAALAYAGRRQLERAMSLLERHVARAFVSVRTDQQADALRGQYPQIADTQSGLGPVAGILAAQAQHPGVAWLVLACDLPRLDDATLAHLLSARDPARTATAYRSSQNGLPEPLCAIYEPRSAALLLAHVAAGKPCPRKFLLGSDVKLLDQPAPGALDNVNTPEEYAAVSAGLQDSGASPARRITVQYYALLREQAGRREEPIETTAGSARELYLQLAHRHSFTLAAETLRVAINNEFCDWSSALRPGDVVVFIPPVAGG
ncbi:MAG: NTP transferase domain-containing protein [Gammaproteobacteria bacterium]|nr:NTP transferase domain-containing protein [Gammaproteobacteria bacterium]MBV9620231.1 NTP transferase domain-containing protein [Gammaproteobacteria bacterium]